MSRKSKRIKWTEEMNRDLLDCKKQAIESLSSESNPHNGRRKGYIKPMTELWIGKGYGHLGLSGQNLRDQAARLEKLCDLETNSTIFSNESLEESQINEVEYATNQASPERNLHTTSPPLVPGEQNNECLENNIDPNSYPGCLPKYTSVTKPSYLSWGRRKDGSIIYITDTTILDAYNVITTWRKNAFLVPYGRVGREFIDQITLHINEWNNSLENQHIALKAAFVLLAVCLQKPNARSKAKEHQNILAKRLALWKDGEIEKLIREGNIIQHRIGKHNKSANSQDKSKVFAKLVMEGRINSALRFLNESSNGGVLPLTDNIMSQLREKHPPPQPAKMGSLLFGPVVDDYPESIYNGIDGEMIRKAALKTKGSGGPSNIDANGFRRILACKSFKQSSVKLCDALATMARTLCSVYIDPSTIDPLLASRLIPLDKGEGAVRPIGVGEVMRRIIGKCVMNIVKPDVIESSGSLQLCAGQKSGSEAAVHAMSNIFEADATDAILLIDASNAFNALNRAAVLHNIRMTCPIVAIFAINTYRQPARLFIIGGQELVSAEGTTQGDPIAMGMYALSLQPLITALQCSSNAKQCWFADDASGTGSVEDIKIWWKTLEEYGPELGYYPNAKKCWIVVKPNREDWARKVFEDTSINITTEGHRHLGAALGSESFREEYISKKVEVWVHEVTKLAEFALSQPQACFAAFSFGLKHCWTYFLRTLPDLQVLLEPLEKAISDKLLPAILERSCSEDDRNTISLPPRDGGLGFVNPCNEASLEYASSVTATLPLVEKIMSQSHKLPDENEVKLAKQKARSDREQAAKNKVRAVKASLPQETTRALDLAAEKGASTWLTVLPLKNMGFDLSKREFRDALRLRYNWPLDDMPSKCVCGEAFSVEHAMVCRRGGFIIQRHDELRNLEADLLSSVCSDVEVEPVLQDITNEELRKAANKAENARLDIHARGFWEKQRSAFFDVRVCYPNADTYKDLELSKIYQMHEEEKKRKYAERVNEIEHGTFTPLVFTTTGGMSKECKTFHSRLAQLISTKKGEDYNTTISWIRAKTCFSLLRSSLVCLRGSRTVKRTLTDFPNVDIEIQAAESNIN